MRTLADEARAHGYEYPFDTRTAPDYLAFREDGGVGPGGAWTFVLLARMRGWKVSEPVPNRYGTFHVYVWERGPDDPHFYLVGGMD